MDEISNENKAKLLKIILETQFIVLSQIAFTIILIVISWFIVQNYDSGASARLVKPLWILIIFIAIGCLILRRVLFRQARLKAIFLTKGVEGFFQTLKTNAVFLGSIAGIIAIIGFVIAVMSGLKYEMFRAGAVALIMFLINFPHKFVWEKIFANMQKSAGDI